ncbi:MAG TPA: MarR family transcriptional regulator [Chloroflexota bacterium]|nr:MarR family transcriptional regulator [Chloroflexota bacterium]
MSIADYQALAEIRYQIRRFLHFSEQAARAADLEPQQYQVLLMLKGRPKGQPATISALAERLQIRHHSVVGLIDRLEERGFVERSRNESDRRQVFVRLTPRGQDVLRDFAECQRAELRSVGQELLRSLTALMVETKQSAPSSSADHQESRATI